VKDTTGSGVYRGGEHSKILMEKTLASGFFPEGLEFRRRVNGEYNGRYRVVGEECGPQTLEPI